MRRGAIPFLALFLFAAGAPGAEPALADPAETAEAASGSIKGIVRTRKGKRLGSALVVLQCACLQGTREAQTNDNGLFRFTGLPPGTYTVRVLSGQADVSKVITLVRGATYSTNFRIDPKNEFKRSIRVKAKPVAQGTSVGRTVSMEEFRNIPVGRSGRDFTQVVESSASASYGSASVRVADEPANREGYAHLPTNDFFAAADRPLSTFSVDVDTASYANTRRFVAQGVRPPAGAVRVEELVNYFDYDYVRPTGKKPVTVNWELAECPWNKGHVLARIGLQTAEIPNESVPARNLVFLLDVSGSMHDPAKLPLLKRAMQLLVDNLRPKDKVSIVVYAGAAGVVLPPTSGRDLPTIRDAIADLEPGGSTNGASGIREAYKLAKKSFIRRGINRVILATDGDFNVGTTSDGELVELIEHKRKSGVFLSVLGFGYGNLQDTKMELLADKGNGNYAYIDSLQEARKVLVDEAGATLVTVAKDVKLQVEFNPAKVADYRLIGYENRLLADKDFEDDSKDAGDMGAGHSVTAIYELVPVKARRRAKAHRLRYQRDRTARAGAGGEWMTVAVRYKPPESDRSRLIEVPMSGTPTAFGRASDDLRFAAAVTAYGMELRDSPHKGTASLQMARDMAYAARGEDRKGYRAAFVELVDATRKIDPPKPKAR